MTSIGLLMKIKRVLLPVLGLFGMVTISLTSMAEEPMVKDDLAVATFAGGCFWCIESDFDKVEGVVATTSGYTGGHKADPSYEEVSAGQTGHAEAVQILFNPIKVSYADLLDIFWRNIDPTTPNRQFCDKGSQYRSAIFFHNQKQKGLAEQSKHQLETSKPFTAPIVTEINAMTTFYRAEEYHQDFHDKNPLHYKFYRFTCGRDRRLKELWGNS